MKEPMNLREILNVSNIHLPQLKLVEWELLEMLQVIEKDDRFESTKDNICAVFSKLELNQEDKKSLQSAVLMMIYFHYNQKNRPDWPYLHHTSGVMNDISEWLLNWNLDIVIAWALHDSVEDQLDKYVSLFGLDADDNVENLRLQVYDIISDLFWSSTSDIIVWVTNPIRKSATLNDEDKIIHYTNHVKQATWYNDKILLCKLSDFSKNWLNLESVNNEKKRLWRSKKYLPSYEYFIGELEKWRLNQFKNKSFIDDKLESLKKALISSQNYILKKS